MDRDENGFTLVEVGVVVPILMIIAIGLFAFMFSYLLSSSREQTRLNQLYDQSTALSRIEEDVRLTNGFIPTNDPSTPDKYDAYSSGQSGWNFAGRSGGPRVLILREYATTNNPLASNRSPVYQKKAGSPDCSNSDNVTAPLSYNIVYFVKDTVLYRRILTNRTNDVCAQQYQKTSCPSLATLGTPSRDPSCQADDERIATGVSNLSVSYYGTGDSTTEMTAYSNPNLLSSALSAQVTIESTGRSYSDPVVTTSSLRVTTKNDQTGA